ncbi:hypothetical protein UY3_09499 [Chelonia mydas]|uniref:Uncharacterized protein n=1 Tax=Chelonia mydas TaxID=8469 RepID=M7BCQ6_CHEMY|nr:hypothetical protein UY3_09499 [Chelonia mydas]
MPQVSAQQRPHDSCLRGLGASHREEHCKICKAFKPRTKKERDFCLKQLLMEAALPPPASDQPAPAPVSSVRSAPASVRDPAPQIVGTEKGRQTWAPVDLSGTV